MVLLAWLAGGSARAQEVFAVDWYTLDNGGNASAGGDYAIEGGFAFGLTSEGGLAGGEYRLDGGFWNIVSDVPAEPPGLAIEPIPSGVRVSWPVPAPGFALEWCPALGANAVWTTVPPPYETNNLTISYQDLAPAANRFYRLRR